MVVDSTQVALGIVVIVIIFRSMILAWRRERRGWSTWLFLTLGLMMSSYVVVTYLSIHPPQPTLESQLFWIRAAISYGGAASPVLLLLAVTYPSTRLGLSKRVAAFIMTVCLAVAAFSYTPFAVSSLRYVKGIPAPVLEIGGMLTIGVLVVGMALATIGVVIRNYLAVSIAEKSQIFYFLIALITTYGLMIMSTTVPLVVLGSTATVFIGPLTWAAFFLIVPLGYPKPMSEQRS